MLNNSFPVTAECRKAVYDGLLKAYEQELTKAQVAGRPAEDKKQAKGGIRENADGFLEVGDEPLPFR